MAAELSIISGVIDNETSVRYGGGGFDVNLPTLTERAGGIQEIGTTEELLEVLPLTSVAGCVAYFKNLDATNRIDLLLGTGGPSMMQLKPGEEFVIRLGADVDEVYAVADTAACKLHLKVWKDA